MYWHSTFGDIHILEPEYRGRGQRLRPFSASAQVSCRGCSLALQRVVVDFGADHAFGQVPHKLREHYGLDLPTSTIRHLTESHARTIDQNQVLATHWPTQTGCAAVVVELDGSMIPIVEINDQAADKRKDKTHCWKEARLCLAHEVDTLSPCFGAVFQGTVEQAGQQLFNCACQAGLGRNTYVHAVGDGAPWIADQVDHWFGVQGHYLIDFYHACGYLGAAANSEAGGDSSAVWLDQHKALLKAGHVATILERLEPYREADEVDDPQAPVRACHRYLSNRVEQLDYPTARARGLPIGSGEIESAHRYVIQARLKLAGAWWTPTNAKSMLALRVMRVNEQWDDYWNELNPAP